MAHLSDKQRKLFIGKWLTKLFWMAAAEEMCPEKIKVRLLAFWWEQFAQGDDESVGNNTNN